MTMTINQLERVCFTDKPSRLYDLNGDIHPHYENFGRGVERLLAGSVGLLVMVEDLFDRVYKPLNPRDPLERPWALWSYIVLDLCERNDRTPDLTALWQGLLFIGDVKQGSAADIGSRSLRKIVRQLHKCGLLSDSERELVSGKGLEQRAPIKVEV